MLSKFHRWLLSPDGGKKDAKTGKQHVAQVKRVLSILGNGGKVESLLEATNIRDIFLGEHAAEKYHPATIKSYLMSLQHFCSFVLSDRPPDVEFNTDDVVRIRDKFKRSSASYKKESTRRRWEKNEEDVSSLITPDKIRQFDKSQASCDAVIVLGKLCENHGKEMMNQAKYTLVRDYLIVQIMIDNANCAGVVSCMTVEEFHRALLEGDRHIIRVLNHKTIDTHGPARVILTKPLYSHIDVYIKEMRSKLPGVESGGKQPLFLSWMGKTMQSNQMTKVVSSIFKKAEIDGPVHHTLYRKSAVSECHSHHKEISSSLADLMAHREVTAQKYYRLLKKNKSSLKASEQLHGVMRKSHCSPKKTPKKSPKKSPKKTPKKNKDKMDDTSDPVVAKRSLWKDESLKAIHNQFKEEISTQNIALSTVKEKIKSDPILHQESHRRVYDRIRLELRKNQNASSIGEPLALPMETEAVESRINRMFEETCSQSSDIMPPTDTTEKSKGIFSAEQAKVLVDLFKDMIKGAPISKPVITTRLQGESMTKTLFKDCTIAQVVNRLKYERRKNYKRVCESNK